MVARQKTFDERKVAAFRTFCTDFFDESSTPKDPLELARHGADKLKGKRDELKAKATAGSKYPFVAQLATPIDLLDQVTGKPDDWYLTDFDLGNDLLEAKENFIDPIQAFLNGPQRTIYDDALAFLTANSSNLGYLPPGSDETVRNALVDPNVFRGNRMAQLKQATDTLRAQIDELVTKEAAATAEAITAKKTEIQTGTDFQSATPEAQQAALSAIDARIAAVQQAREIPHIREARTSFEVTQYPALLDQLAASARPAPQAAGGEGEAAPKPTPAKPVETISIKTITVPGTHGVLTSSDDVERYIDGAPRHAAGHLERRKANLTLMETAPLKSFATWARTSLIREVTARVAVVLAPGSPERIEQPKAVTALEAAVRATGGGETGRAAVADQVAYTWFNRIIALRFMDANGYTGIGIVSPQAAVEGGQPEILAEAKRGNIDGAVVGARTRELVTALLNGTRRSGDPQGEAFALLLAEYCRHWNRAMPFMFEREGDYTELLIPANLLADDSVLSRAVKVLTTDVCQDVEVIGWLYQFYISERKDEVFAGFKKNKKAGAAEIPAATQLFTPHWIVRYLVENSVGRLWMLNHPSSRLVDQMEYYIAPVDEETDFPKISRPEKLTVIDPACGSGHMLTYAFDLLYAIYEEEGYAPAEIPGLVLTNNLYGVEIDPRAGALAAFALTMKARARQRTFFSKQVEPTSASSTRSASPRTRSTSC